MRRNELVADFMVYIGVALGCAGVWSRFGFSITAMVIGPVLVALGVFVSLNGKDGD